MEELAKQDGLHGDGWQIFPRVEANQGQVQLGKGVHARRSAEVVSHFARLEHAWIGGGHTGQFECQVTFDRGIDLCGAVEVNIPSTILKLH